jgi:hypothetical protein
MVDTRIVEIRSVIIPIKRISPLVTRYGTNEFLPAVVVKVVSAIPCYKRTNPLDRNNYRSYFYYSCINH